MENRATTDAVAVLTRGPLLLVVDSVFVAIECIIVAMLNIKHTI